MNTTLTPRTYFCQPCEAGRTFQTRPASRCEPVERTTEYYCTVCGWTPRAQSEVAAAKEAG